MRKEDIFNTFSDIPTLTTARLTLRRMSELDAEDMYAYARRADVTEFLRWSPHASLSFTKEYLRYIERRYALGDFYDWAIVERESGKMIGTCGFAAIDIPNSSAELGYVLNPEYRGKELAVEAAREVVRFGFETLGLHRIEARFMVGNEASQRVMEKLGMSPEGFARDSVFVKGKYITVGKYAILSGDFFK